MTTMVYYYENTIVGLEAYLHDFVDDDLRIVES
jgi:hypothetical protein